MKAIELDATSRRRTGREYALDSDNRQAVNRLEPREPTMPRNFGNTAFEPMQETRDKELTLGPVALIGLAVALFGVCGVFFVWGYAVGHRNAPEQTGVQVTFPLPATETLTGTVTGPKTADTDFAASIVSRQSPTPVHNPPFQPTNRVPRPAVAVSAGAEL